jgi:Rod binding domain-containing protein
MTLDSTFSRATVPITALRSREDSLIQTGQIPTDAAKIEKGAKEFEAVLLGSWLQQAEQSFASIPGADEEQDTGGEQMMSMGVQSLATSIADAGGLGIGKMIAKAMHHAVDKEDAVGASNSKGGAAAAGSAAPGTD